MQHFLCPRFQELKPRLRTPYSPVRQPPQLEAECSCRFWGSETFGCHSTEVPGETNTVEPKVQCQRCHAGAEAHARGHGLPVNPGELKFTDHFIWVVKRGDLPDGVIRQRPEVR